MLGLKNLNFCIKTWMVSNEFLILLYDCKCVWHVNNVIHFGQRDIKFFIYWNSI